MNKTLKKTGIVAIVVFITTISIFAREKTTHYTKQLTDIQEETLSKSMARGKEIYTDFCMQCHLPDGKGTGTIIPPLAGSDWLIDKRKESIQSIKYGLNGPIKVNDKTYNNVMTSQGLEDEEIADVMNYIMNSWGNTQEKMVTAEEVAKIEKQ